jgi:hypothetical protein
MVITLETAIPVDISPQGERYSKPLWWKVNLKYPLLQTIYCATRKPPVVGYQFQPGCPILVSKYLPDLQENSPYEGVLILDNYSTTGGFSKEDQALATSLAQQAALTLANYGLFEEAEQRASQLKALTRVSTAITSSLHKNSLLSTLLDQLQSVVPYDTGTLWVRNQETLVVLAARGFDDADNRLGLSVNVDDSTLF